MGLVDESFFVVIAPYINLQRVNDSARPRNRIEVNTPPDFILAQALAFLMPCVKCGSWMHPFRRRGPARRGVNVGGLYYAACCRITGPNSSIGCSRGTAASDEYKRIIAAVRRFQKPPPPPPSSLQPPLFRKH